MLILALLVAGTCVTVALSSLSVDPRTRKNHQPGKDIQLYWDMTKGIQSGLSYYESANRGLRHHGYPTSSVFNWRTPLPMWLLAQMPSPRWGNALIASLATIVFLLLYHPMQREFGRPAALLAVLLILGALAQCFVGVVFIMPVAWASVFIGLSLGCFATNQIGLAVLLGCAAPFFRDLALGYTGLMFLFAIANRQKMESLGLLTGIAAYLGFFYYHALQVRVFANQSSVAEVSAWLQAGGLPFVLITSAMNAFLLVLPQWVAALYLSVVMVGIVGWKSAWGVRVSVVVIAYLGVFSLIGQTFNMYWGTLIAPLMAVCFVAGVMGLRVLVRRAFFLKPEPVGTT